MKKIKIAAAGDIAMMKQPEKSLFRPADIEFDLFIANLEGPIVSTAGVPAEKPIRMRLPKEAAAWLKDMGIGAVSLANNHTLDWGIEGLDETIFELEKAGIRHAGAGKNAQQAAAPVFFDLNGHKIAFLSWAATVPSGFQALNNRPGIAGIKVRTSFVVDTDMDEQPGTPPWVFTDAMEQDLKCVEDSIRLARQSADFIILAMHWGVPPKESSNAQGCVADYQAQIVDCAVEAGVDLILGHHCHIPLGLEIYDGIPVLYSLGNYIFHNEYLPGGLDITMGPVPYNFVPGNKDSCFTQIELSCEENGSVHVERIAIYPCVLNEIGEAVAATKEEAAAIVNRIYTFSIDRKANVKNVDNVLVWEANQSSQYTEEKDEAEKNV